MTAYSTFRDVIEHTEERRRDFFRLVFGNSEGFVCISYKGHLDKTMDELFFKYPEQLDEMCRSIDRRAKTLTHVYFCPQLLKAKKRIKENALECTTLWADLDTCNPQVLQVPASIVVQSSLGRWQAIWRLESPIPPLVAESISRKITYFHADQGSDPSGWDLTQLLRVPYTPNYKYGDLNTAPVVVVVSTNTALYRKSDFDVYPEYNVLKFASSPIPVDLPTEKSVDILQRYRTTLNPQAFGLFNDVPEMADDWSKSLWKLEKYCVEAGLKIEETYKIALEAGCNKYNREGRSELDLWHEVQKAYVKDIEQHNLIPTPTSVIPNIISDEEVKRIQRRITFVERYIRWASELTDAPTQYHQAGAFIILSSLISGTVRLPTSFGTIIPNLWFMILADTTITRKSTTLKTAVNLLLGIYPDAIMATDGSAEGILTALKNRPNQPSIYLRDEFSGLLEAMTHKDYMAGMSEHFTKLYDGDTLKRLLRKEEIIITNPIFIIFAAGIKSKIQRLLTEEHINSGFIPRFVFITAEADVSRIRPIGPPKSQNNEERDLIQNELFGIYDHYNRARLVIMPDGKTEGYIKPEMDAELTEDAWKRYNDFETALMNAAIDTGLWHLTPVYDRLAKSTLKAAILIAACRMENNVIVTVEDIIHAIYYARFWFSYANEIVNSIGKTSDERLIDSIMELIEKSGQLGVSRSEIMRLFRLDSRKADLIFSTIIQRRLVVVTQYKGQPRYTGAF